MNRSRIFGIVSISLSSLVTWFYIITQVHANKEDTFVMLTFFVSLAVWLGSLLSFIFYWIKVKQGNHEIVYAHLRPSIRQGFLIAFALCAVLFLQLLRVLSVWDAALVVIVFFLFEIALRQSDIPRKVGI